MTDHEEITETQVRAEMPDTSMAELLIYLAEAVLFPKDLLLVVPNGIICTSYRMQRVNLAIRFYNREPAFRFRAIVENWDLNRIVRELY